MYRAYKLISCACSHELDFECDIVLVLDQQTANQKDSVLLAADELWLQRTIIAHIVTTYA